nr:MAG TPA: Protein of unknown function (DUF551) [Caudoviricetes sp.]
MRNLEKGQHIFIAFQDGKAVLDSQLRPRMYTSLENADKWTPTVNKGKIEYVEYAPTLTPQNEWVSVEERLPTDERTVLVFVGYADTMTGFITTSSYFCFDANPHWQWDGLVRDEQRTLFWMPLPAPPKKEHDHE